MKQKLKKPTKRDGRMPPERGLSSPQQLPIEEQSRTSPNRTQEVNRLNGGSARMRPKGIILTLIVLVTAAMTVIGHAASGKQAPEQRAAPPIDPTTGLPVPLPTEWKDPGWIDPDIVLTNVVFENLPLEEVTKILRDQFKAQFDILLPVQENGSWEKNWRETIIQLRLKNVTASEVFNAMNLVFDTDKTPLRWELKMNGSRPTVLLRVLTDPIPHRAPQPPREPTRTIYFVGDLIGDKKSGGMSIEELVNTVSDIVQMTYGEPKGVIQFHKDAQLLIVTGTPDHVQFIQQALMALRQKVNLAHQKADWGERFPQRKTTEPTEKKEESKAQ